MYGSWCGDLPLEPPIEWRCNTKESSYLLSNKVGIILDEFLTLLARGSDPTGRCGSVKKAISKPSTDR